MFDSRRLNNEINYIHERALRIIYQDCISTFQELLNKNNSVSIHHRNFKGLSKEMFKVHRAFSQDILREIRHERRQVRSVYHGTESLSFVGQKIWDLVPLELKQLENLEVLKWKINKWIPFECPCRLCRTYIQQAGFV